MTTRMGRSWKRFKSAPPGERFQQENENSPLRSRQLRAVLLGLAVLLIAAGVATLLIPPIPGITLVLFGTLLAARLSMPIARLCDRAEVWLRKQWKRMTG